MNRLLTGKVALVTGASRGIGRAIAKRLSGEGAAVAVNYATQADEARKLVAEIESDGGEAIAIQADISRVSEVVRLFDETLARFGRLDIFGDLHGVLDEPAGAVLARTLATIRNGDRRRQTLHELRNPWAT